MAASIVRVQRTSNSPRQTMALGRRFAKRLKVGDVVCLEGPLGAGKTCFARGLAEGVGVAPTAVSSPTFVLCQIYESPSQRVAHIDAYRLASAEELRAIGWDELASDSRTIVVIEWPQRVAEALPERRLHVHIEHMGPSQRRITLTAPPELADRLEHLDG